MFNASRLCSCLGAAVVALSFVSATALAAPMKVQDDGRFFEAQTIEQVNTTVATINNTYGWDVSVKTFAEIPQPLQARLQAEGKETFYEKWLRNEATHLGTHGVFILLVRNPGRVQVGVGRDAVSAGVFTAKDRDELRTLMLGKLATREYDAALLDGAQFILHRMEEHVKAGAKTRNQPDVKVVPTPATHSLPDWPVTTAPAATAPASTAPASTAPATEAKSDAVVRPDESAKPKVKSGDAGSGITTDKPDTSAKPDANKTDSTPKPKDDAKPGAGGGIQ